MVKLKRLIIPLILLIAVTAAVSYKNIMGANNKREALQESKADEANTSLETIKNITTDEAKKLLDSNKDIMVLDVRTKLEYNQGHLKGAIVIPYDELEKRYEEIIQYKDKPILVYCRTGRRGSAAAETLKKLGFTNIYHMYEGIIKWKYELEK